MRLLAQTKGLDCLRYEDSLLVSWGASDCFTNDAGEESPLPRPRALTPALAGTYNHFWEEWAYHERGHWGR